MGGRVVPSLARKQTDLTFTLRAEQSRDRSRFVESRSVVRRIPTAERPSNGWCGRKSRSVKRHQPLVRPKTDSVHNCGVATSMNIRVPPGASSS